MLKELKITTNNSTTYYRLIALWVICEAFVGGIIHGIKLPVSGIVVGSCAVVCISLIAKYVPAKGAIIKATIIVAIFKMMLSPQSPPMAYVAVFFQGLLGEILFSNKKYFKAVCIAFAILALLESGLQRILVLAFVYGKNFWIVVDETISKLFLLQSTGNFSIALAFIYLIIHCIAGIAAGMFVLQIVKKINDWKTQLPQFIFTDIVIENNYLLLMQEAAKKKKHYPLFLILYVLLLFLYLQSAGYSGKPFFTHQIIAGIFLRSSIILLSWFLIAGPVITKLIQNWLSMQKSKSQKDVSTVLLLLPSMKNILVESWKQSAINIGWNRISLCCKIVLINTLSNIND